MAIIITLLSLGYNNAVIVIDNLVSIIAIFDNGDKSVSIIPIIDNGDNNSIIIRE